MTGIETKPRVLACALLIAVLAFVRGPSVPAAWSQSLPRGPSYEFVLENDALFTIVPFAGRSDREYTNGIWIATERERAPGWGRLLPRIPACASIASLAITPAAGNPLAGGTRTVVGASAIEMPCLRTNFEIGQKLYTPDTTSGRIPDPDERPYAGWLYGAVTARAVSDRTARSLRLELGVTGPPALGEQTQRFVHWLIHTYQPESWDDQLPFEPGVLVRYEERHRLAERVRADGSSAADLIASASGSLGNVRTGIDAALTGRIGRPLPHPWSRAAPDRKTAWSGFAEVRARWTGYELFLDGTAFRDSRGVKRIPITGVWMLGGTVDYRETRMRVAVVGESRAYETQPRAHRYFSVRFTFRP